MKAHAIEGVNLLSYDGLKPAASYQPEELYRKTFGSENGLGYLELMFGSDNAAKLEQTAEAKLFIEKENEQIKLRMAALNGDIVQRMEKLKQKSSKPVTELKVAEANVSSEFSAPQSEKQS